MPHIPLRTASPVGPLDDLAPFLELAATRSVIGLGEATHGTREAFQLKHRLIRALAEQGGLTTIAFECGLAAGRLIDDYVRLGHGTAREALAQQGYWCWENHEVLALIEWLKEHNAPLPLSERVAFMGVDVQKVEPGLPELLAALEHDTYGQEPDPSDRTPAQHESSDAIQVLRQLSAGQLARGAPEAAPAVRALLEAAPYLATPELRALCRNAARYVDTYLNPERANGLAVRDEYLAATALETLAERPGLIAVWAHNEHVAVNPDFFGTRAMGHHLREALGAGYLALGMLFSEGSFLARSWEAREVSEFSVGLAGESHVERSFTGLPLGLYGGAHLPVSPGARHRRFVGMLYDHGVDAEHPDAFRIERPLSDFDVVAWLPETTAARFIGVEAKPLATGSA